MPKAMNVHPELLAAAAAAAASQSQTVLAIQNTAATTVDAALDGWVGGSQTALTSTARRWAELSARLNLRLYRHSEALRIAGLTFAEMDSGHARRFSGIRPPAPA